MERSNPVMTLEQLKEFNNAMVDKFDRKEISNLEYYNARMFVLLSIQNGNFLPDNENEEDND